MISDRCAPHSRRWKCFLGALYTGYWKVTTHAVAGTGEKANAKYILQAQKPRGIYVNGDMTIQAKDGSIISNYNIVSGGNSIIVITDGFIDAGGTIKSSDLWQAPWGIREDIGVPIPPSLQVEYDRYEAIARTQAGAAEWEHTWYEGRTLSLADVIDTALQELA